MTKQIYIPSDEWLYYKIYCGVKTADEIITQAVLPVSRFLKKKENINKWFFIRYADPDLHLRVRFHFSNINNVGIIMHEMNTKLRPFVESNKIWKVMLDTYQREIERYHPLLIENAEDLFCVDSETIASFLGLIYGSDGEKVRWMFSFKNIDALLSDFGLSLVQKQVFIEGVKNSFAKEFGMNKNLKYQLDQKYRNVTPDIRLVMNLNKKKAGEYFDLVDLLEKRSALIAGIVSDIREVEKKNPNIDFSHLLSSYVHMTMNRLFRSKQRMHELVVYDFLYRFYCSEIAKEKQKSRNALPIYER